MPFLLNSYQQCIEILKIDCSTRSVKCTNLKCIAHWTSIILNIVDNLIGKNCISFISSKVTYFLMLIRLLNLFFCELLVHAIYLLRSKWFSKNIYMFYLYFFILAVNIFPSLFLSFFFVMFWQSKLLLLCGRFP